MRLLNALAAILAVSTLSACQMSVQGNKGVTKPGEQSGGFMGLAKQDDLKVDSENAFKGTKDVVIGSFKVGFLTDKADSRKAGGGLMGNGLGGKSKANLKLNGITDAMRQEITEKAYSNFVSELKAKGFNIIDKSKLYADSDFADTKSYETPYDDDGTIYFTPKTFGKLKFFMGDSPSFSGGFAFGNPSISASVYAEKNKTKVLSVTYLVDFANSDGHGGSWTSTSSVSVGQGISVVPGSKLALIGGQSSTFSNANGNITLGQAVYSTKEFGKLKETSSDTYKTAETVLNVATTLLGAGSNITRDFEIDANPAKYKAVVGEVLSDTNKAIVQKFSSLK